ncbi:MAG TPA: hypothetical protein PKE30_14830 [Niabella sp.]|nr:hypothetical protein [Niabella sp.]
MLSFILLISIPVNAQYYNDYVRIDSADRSYIFMITDDSRITSYTKYYHWFKSGRIHTTQGSYYGKLLHGTYKVIDTERHLLEEGKFRKGLKTGLWRTWYENGTLKSSWNRRFGLFGNYYNIREYDHKGNLIKKGYENSKGFTGYQVEWLNDSAVVVQYKKGMLL